MIYPNKGLINKRSGKALRNSYSNIKIILPVIYNHTQKK